MIKTFKNIFCALLLLLSPMTAVKADTLAKLNTFLSELETFSAAFEQQLLNEYGEILEKSVGVVYLRRPGMFHWSYWEPFLQQIISDGQTLWVYDEDLEQVTIRDVLQSIDDTPAALLSGEVELEKHYIIVELQQQQGVDWLELTPRDIDSQYRTLRLGFRDEQLAGMMLFDNLGQETIISFKNPKKNPSLDRGQFQFSPPDGIDVIDSRQP